MERSEINKKISDGLMGHEVSDETRQKQSAKNRGMFPGEATPTGIQAVIRSPGKQKS